MGKIPASYHLRKAFYAEDIFKSIEFYGYFQKQMLVTSFFIVKEYSDAWKAYFSRYQK